jgi:hypothetical protein
MAGKQPKLRMYAEAQTMPLPAGEAVALVALVSQRLVGAAVPGTAGEGRATFWCKHLAEVEPVLAGAQVRSMGVTGRLAVREVTREVLLSLTRPIGEEAANIGFTLAVSYAPGDRPPDRKQGEYVSLQYAPPGAAGLGSARLVRLWLWARQGDAPTWRQDLVAMADAARFPMVAQMDDLGLTFVTTVDSAHGPQGTRLAVSWHHNVTHEIPLDTPEQVADRVLAVLSRRRAQNVFDMHWDTFAGKALSETGDPEVWRLYHRLLELRLPARNHEVRARVTVDDPELVVRLLTAADTKGTVAAAVGQVMLDDERLLNVSLEGNAKGAALTFACRYGVAVEEIAALFGGDLVLKPRGYMGRGNLMAGMDG